MITSYYNTTKEIGKQLVQSKVKAYSQEQAIMDIFFDNKRKWDTMSPSNVWHIYCTEFKEAPLSSIRARMTSLTNRYKLVKTDEMRMGIYDKFEHCWRLAKPEDKQIPLL